MKRIISTAALIFCLLCSALCLCRCVPTAESGAENRPPKTQQETIQELEQTHPIQIRTDDRTIYYREIHGFPVCFAEYEVQENNPLVVGGIVISRSNISLPLSEEEEKALNELFETRPGIADTVLQIPTTLRGEENGEPLIRTTEYRGIIRDGKGKAVPVKKIVAVYRQKGTNAEIEQNFSINLIDGTEIDLSATNFPGEGITRTFE